MKYPKFELNKATRAVKTLGVEYTFFRNKPNVFKESAGVIEVAKILGVFHQYANHVYATVQTSATVQTKPTPNIFTLYEGAQDITQGDYVIINGKKYIVTGVINPNDWNICLDISLEVENNGNNL